MEICKFLWFGLLMLLSFSMVGVKCQNASNISHLRNFISNYDADGLLKNKQVMATEMSIQETPEQSLRLVRSPWLVEYFQKFVDRENLTDLEVIETSNTGEIVEIVSIKVSERMNHWSFLKPLTTSLWLIIGAFFVYRGIVVCVLEHPVNKTFQGERVIINLTRFMVIILVFVVFDLESSYTRFLSSEVTLLQHQPTITYIQHSVLPKGWVALSSRNKLKVGVIVRKGFDEFSKIERNKKTNDVEATGFCVDVFKQVMESMPYVVPYTFSPFQTHEESVEDYNTLVDQMFGDKKYDVLVGDVTITSKRSEYIDFTFPYTESGIAAIVHIKVSERTNRWIFLKPLTTSLWLTIGAFFVYTGIVVWVLEHRVNKAFQGPPLQQIGIIFWFSFSTFVFAHREKVISNLTRFVVIVWMFVVLVLASSYTANLASMLTSRQLQPTTNNIDDLIKSGEYIGYQDGSFVGEFVKNMKFKGSKFRNYTSFEEYNEALSKGSKNGGVAAIVDELPYIRLFLSKYCHKYTMIGPTYPTPGFGFIFPYGSPLVADVSRAILKVKEGEEIVRISKKWFKRECLPASDEDGTLTISESLNLDSFKGLFLIAGLSSASALAIFLSIFLYENRRMLTSTASLKQKLYLLSRAFYLVEDDIASSKESTSGGEGRVTTESLAICIASDRQGTCNQNEGSSTPDHATHAHHIP